MDPRDLEILQGFDPANLTIADLRQVKNTVLRQALFSAVQSLVSDHLKVGAEHSNHWAHTNHGKSIFLDVVFPEVPTINPTK